MPQPNPVPHPVDLVEQDLAESRKLLAGCLAAADSGPPSVRLEFIGAATRLLRHNAQAAGLLLREAHTCLRDDRRRPKPPQSVRRQRAEGDRSEPHWFIDYAAELAAEENLKTIPCEPEMPAGPRIRTV